MEVKQKIEEILRHYRKREIPDENLIPSAVLLPLFHYQEQYHVLFTERSEEVNAHKGQVCFPGGTYQLSDSSLLQTALREVEEEIDLKAEDVEILGELDDIRTITTDYIISPFVGFIPYPYPFKADYREIKEIFSVPLLTLMDETKFRQYSYEHEGHIIWGATARILKQFTELLRSGSRT